MNSIKTRLAGGLTLSLILLMLLQWWLLGSSTRQLTEHYLKSRLQNDAESLLAALVISAERAAVNTSRIANVYDRPLSGHYYLIYVGATEIRSRSLWDVDLQPMALNVGETAITHAKGPSKQSLLLLHTAYLKNNHLVRITIAEDQTELLLEITAFQNAHAGITLVVLVLLIVLQSFIVGQGLSPLKKARQEINALEQGIINALDENVPSELLPLIKELNHQLTAFKRRLDRSRNASGNLAHALKSPLALLVQLTEQAVFDAHPDLRQRILVYTSAIQQTIDRELRRSRLAGGQGIGNRARLHTVTSELLDVLTKMHREKTIQVELNVAKDLEVLMERQDLTELLGNILDNAYKWARQSVRISASQTDGLCIRVEDDGPGCSLEDLNALTERGKRADENINGHGLGLSIVADILEEYGGTLGFSRATDLGGLCVEIKIEKLSKKGADLFS